MPRARKKAAVPAEAPAPALAETPAPPAVAETQDARSALTTAAGTDHPQLRCALLNDVIAALGVPAGTEAHTERGAAAIALMAAFQARDAVEAMMAGQAVALNNAGMAALRRATNPDLPPEVASRLRRDAVGLFRASADLVGAIEARRGGGARQRIVVEHISQAIIGAQGEGFRE